MIKPNSNENCRIIMKYLGLDDDDQLDLLMYLAEKFERNMNDQYYLPTKENINSNDI